jgi:hypothetical protein
LRVATDVCLAPRKGHFGHNFLFLTAPKDLPTNPQ